MKPTLLLAALTVVFTTPTALAESELEMLRRRCAEQDRQIRLLEEENSQLMSLAKGEKTRAYPNLISNPAPAKAGTTMLINNTSEGSYTIVAGDNLVKIARKVGTTPEALAKLNGIKMSTIIHPGKKLKVPASAAAKSVAATEKPAPVAAKAEVPSATAGTHKVKSGETFYSIARKHRISTDALVAANPGVKPASLQVGQTLKLSASASVAQVSKPAESTQPAPASKPVQSTQSAQASKTSTPPPTARATEMTATSSAPKPTPSANKPSTPTETPAAPEKKTVIHTVTIEGEVTYGEFASKHGTSPERLNELNGLDLNSATVLAKGSELYIPAQP